MEKTYVSPLAPSFSVVSPIVGSGTFSRGPPNTLFMLLLRTGFEKELVKLRAETLRAETTSCYLLVWLVARLLKTQAVWVCAGAS